MHWVDFKDTCPNRILNIKYGYLCNEPGRLVDPVGLKGCIERYCPFCTVPSEDVKFPLELLGLEIKMTNKRFAKTFEVKSVRCKHRKTGDLTVSEDESLCLKDKDVDEAFCSIYSCPYVNKENDDAE